MPVDFEILPNEKAKSDIWKFLGLKYDARLKEIVDWVAVCNLCKATVKNSGRTTNLKAHMEHSSQNLNSFCIT